MSQKSVLTMCVVLLTAIFVFGVLYQAKVIFAPIISALLLGVIMAPLSDLWERLHIPPALAAFLSVTLALLAIMALLFLIEPYVTKVIDRAPVIWNELRGTVEELKRAMRGLEKITEDVAAAIETDGDGVANVAGDDSVKLPTLTDALFYAPQFAAQFLTFTGTLYFFLFSKNDVYEWVSRTDGDVDEATLREAGHQVSRYVLTISAINLSLGVLVGIAMQLIGMPSPVLWGILAFVLNFILYLGPIALIAALLVTGIVVFDGPSSFLPAAVYIAMNATEAQFVTPTMIGRSLSVNPLLVFLSLVFWLWLWGPIGGIIAIPVLIWGYTIYKTLSGQAVLPGLPDKTKTPARAEPAP